MEILWLKSCIKDFKDFDENEFIRAESKLKQELPYLLQSASNVFRY
ncbi:MAG: hypothetical protein ACP5OG_02865 [Candidatus Nanoarchaeia archaeon]